MKRLLFLSFLLFIFCVNASGQLHFIAGSVKDESGKPLSGVEVFLSGTARLTITDEEGIFNLSLLAAGNYELVAKIVGREHYHASFTLTKSAKFDITLPLKARRLRQVVVQSETPSIVGEADYAMFKKTFLGQTHNSFGCKILNPEVVNIYTDPETKMLHADSGGEYIEIENMALGYRLRYILEGFIIDTKKSYSYYLSQFYFQEMEGSPKKKQDWEKARRIAYDGSPQHLLKAIYENRVVEEGFQIRIMTKIPNKESISELMYLEKRRKLDSLFAVKALRRPQYNDSLYDLGTRAHIPAHKQIVSDRTISSTSLIGRADGPNKELKFTGDLYIRYDKERPALGYFLPHQIKTFDRQYQDGQVSVLSMREAMPMLDSSGNLTNSLSLSYTGYLGWERVADMLPKDYIYQPIHKKEP